MALVTAPSVSRRVDFFPKPISSNFDPGFDFPTAPLPADANPNAVQIAVGSGARVWVLDASDEVFTFVRP